MKFDKTKTSRSILALGILLGASTACHATIIGFGNLGGNNTNIAAGFVSNASADGNGFVVSNGTTPDIALLWDNNWDIHTSNRFDPLEAQTIGGGAWDNESNIARIGQLDGGIHTIKFTPNAGFAVVLNSFDFAHTNETAGTTSWNLSLTDSSLNTVWTQTVGFTNGQTFTITPNFHGQLGQSYTLNFNRTASSYGSDGRHGIDNLSFNQSLVPEPSSAGLLGIAGLVLLKRRRK
ncbi:PEP-CTERM sorting domain-containing protein [Luteolibacter yonseiensis]|uniref:PEP-CTERM sorting domain-containing protein n=1 Tax=Luteolibacter yonseiensis TaxID=1144680 RepID=A0A934VE04_9BACT|nr:PEP-CTERM sorting domain-containing protein [Luteolibacter yonseiensis]MBK1818109.1 PEP-CTERM sorting domain-containing protein [Luteolibacter yonseiensis]